MRITINPIGAPRITSALTAPCNVGSVFSYKMEASGNAPIAFNATNLPSWASFAADTISGTSSATGSFNVTLSASNGLGTDTKTLAITISAPGAPKITSLLKDNARSGQSYSYTIIADGTAPITCGAFPLPGWLTLTTNGNTATLSGTPQDSDVGNLAITLTATNASGTDSEQLLLTVGPATTDPPTITDIQRSRNPVRTNIDVSFTTVGRSPSGLPLYFTWYFFYGDSPTPDGVLLSGNPVTRQGGFPAEGKYTVQAVASDNFNKNTAFQTFAVTLAPNSGSDAASVLNGAQALNPVGGLGIGVPESVGGVLNLDLVEQQGQQPDPNETFQTTIPTLPDKYDGRALAGKFSLSQVFVIETIGTRIGGEQRKARLMVPVSGWETGNAPVSADGRKSTGLTSFQLKGKFNLGKRPDAVTLSGEFELPGRMAAKNMPIAVGLGNLTGQASVDAKGRVVGLESDFMKRVQINWPRLDKKNPVTKTGDKAKITITLQGKNLHLAGFDTEGITNQGLTPKQAVDRHIQVALVIGGVSYYHQAKSSYVLNKDTGQLMGRLAK